MSSALARSAVCSAADGVSGGAEQDLAAVVDLAGDHGCAMASRWSGSSWARCWAWRSRGLPAVGPTRRARKRPIAGEPADGAAVVGAPQEQFVGDGHAAEHDDVVDADQGEELRPGWSGW